MATSQQRHLLSPALLLAWVHCCFAGGCPLSMLNSLWSPSPKYLLLHREAYLLLPGLKAEPLASSSSDETSWAPSASSRCPFHHRDWERLFLSRCVFWGFSLNFICRGLMKPCMFHVDRTFLMLIWKEPCSWAALPRRDHIHLFAPFCPGLDLRHDLVVVLGAGWAGNANKRGDATLDSPEAPN